MAADGNLKIQLEEVCQDLWWSSESDYPVEVVWAASSVVGALENSAVQGEAAVREWLLHNVEKIEDADALVSVDVEDFFERSLTPKSWHTAEDKAQIAQLCQLKSLLERSLQHLQVYRYGKVEVLIYVLGYTPAGAIAGVKTCLVET